MWLGEHAMTDLLLWKRLEWNDMNAIHGRATHAGSGGGAMHIALGTNRGQFPIAEFLRCDEGETHKEVTATAPNGASHRLRFNGKPGRRGGEWHIQDQRAHRHPAWSPAVGFPSVYPNDRDEYKQSDRPIVLVARVDDRYYADFVLESALSTLPRSLAAVVSGSKNKGITPLPPGIRERFGVASKPLDLHDAEATRVEENEEEFAPDSNEDGRKKIIAKVVQRQGQSRFRRALLEAYGGTCPVTGCSVENALHAAHISPYRGARTNHVTNGMPLRADIHNLFDLGFLAVGEDYRLRVSSRLADAEYESLAGRKIRLPARKYRPAKVALRHHLKGFQP
mgnify:FL=1